MRLHAKDCELYYCRQVGGGDPYFQGILHQRGYGFFADLRRHMTPLLIRAGKYLGKRMLETGRNVMEDVSSGSSIRDATRKRLRETAKGIKGDIFQKLQSGGTLVQPSRRSLHNKILLAKLTRQLGSGIKRKRRKTSTQSKKKRCEDVFS